MHARIALVTTPDGLGHRVRRNEPEGSLAGGRGIHFCLGTKFAGADLRVVLEVLMEKLRTLRLVPDQKLAFDPNITFRGPRAPEVTGD